MSKTLENQQLGLQNANNIAITVLLVSLGMLFATFLLALFMYKLTATTWPPMGLKEVALYPPLQSTLIILLSSFTYMKFESLFARSNPKYKNQLIYTIYLGVLFLISQVWIWSLWLERGITVDMSIYGSIIYVMTGVHGAHIVLSLLSLFYVQYIVQRKEKNKTQIIISNVGKVWHFLTIVWLIILVTTFIW
ncbi:MAG: hypothetical protein HOJ35_10505 [Bdellovibrionales bacterium]|jgi:cytochrome c oxidase subunit III|nr:hypothetical protein [Bdellovibrionales bacterium]